VWLSRTVLQSIKVAAVVQASLIDAQKPDRVHKADATVSGRPYLISQRVQTTHSNMHPLASNGSQFVGVKEHMLAFPGRDSSRT
jgi:hypothetical protein